MSIEIIQLLGNAPPIAWLGAASALLIALIAGWIGGYATGRHATTHAVQRAIREAEMNARARVVHEVRMVEHAHLKAGVLEALFLLRRARDSSTPEQRLSWIKETERSLERLTNLVQDLHRRGAAIDPHHDSEVTPVNLERTVVEVCKSMRNQGVHIVVERTGMPRADVPRAIQAVVELALYNALINACHHGNPQRILVQLGYEFDALTLRVSDDGRGFDPARTMEGRGLRDIRERVQQIGGTLHLDSAPGRGTTVMLSIPLHPLRLGWTHLPSDHEQHDQRHEPRGNGSMAPPWQHHLTLRGRSTDP